MDAGRAGERAAEKEARRRGMTVLERNLVVSGAEIDLVALDGEVLVFVEVKARRSDSHGTPEEFVDREKRGRIIRGRSRTKPSPSRIPAMRPARNWPRAPTSSAPRTIPITKVPASRA